MQAVFGQVLIPREVFAELTRHGDHVPGAREVRSSSWIRIGRIRDVALADRLCRTLDRGEAEAIALAIETGARTLIIDEYAGRQVAVAMGLRIVGIRGILIEAKRRGLIDAVRPLLDDLRTRAGFRLGKAMRERVLREVGEE
jgi:predicted nucleic acid-binding protein